ncbi:somatomedin-B and thrombospondin type-1 domain-containing protein isoform X1 [Neofelis nebulosa]|uniref:somatomedin-B and thrombospondin type-1 domain-containing protein isoform X1 n=1 Tax=Neofelis nebulosa TaxID=61452 RepID=UPI00272BDFF5|nr:somatomedin-B and thrombospondin type-1 domain-containing protein isoform X1 [Neofelis nebulosa]
MRRFRRSLGRRDPQAPAAPLSPGALPRARGAGSRRAGRRLRGAPGRGALPTCEGAAAAPARARTGAPPGLGRGGAEGGGPARGRAGPGCASRAAGAAPGRRSPRSTPLAPKVCGAAGAARSSGHEDPVDGAVRAGAAVAGDPGRLRRGGALLPRPGRRLLRAWLEVGQGLRDVLLRPSLPPHGGLLLRLRQGVPSSPLHRGGVEPLERLRGPVQAGGPRAEAPGAAGASERRRALPAPGRESRLPGLLDAPGPGLRALLRPCLHNYLCIQQGENTAIYISTVVYRHRGQRILYGVQD